MGQKPLASVVTPFYNTHEYLAECIESVLRQTYENWEYILVDNFSTDGSSEIAARFAAQNPGKVRLIHTESFLSQVQNYNFALSCVSPNSKYCKLVQADDWILPDCLQSMVKVAEAYPEVGIVSAYEVQGDNFFLCGLPFSSAEMSGRDVCRIYFEKNIYLFGTPTSLLMRSELVRSRKPFYDERYAPFEDCHVCFDVLRDWNFGFAHQVLTYTRRNNDSMLSRISSYEFELFSRLAVIVAHGKDYLSVDEYRKCLADAERKYFYFLGLSAMEGRAADFWKFHRERLASIGYSLNSGFMAKWILVVLLDYIGNPKRTIEYLWERRGSIFAASSRFIRSTGRIFVRRQLSAKL